ncbi:hypothetical protein CAPTEDRAFT_199334 [Capitella teleta]|uniref:Uncharacterized protein n=1 Tax=Capitella teleta TaxID=283909 RepID=R7U280_CAPTE|nr:hypothetical protein CAPTEDRAFT_199334 [Capitella teleta]|eukprot:ELT97275.1 hypothetical protein CAPTEDRAFT_199334 [Capitella teleta]
MQRHQPQPWDRAEIRNWMDTGIIGYDDYWRPNSNERMVLVYEMLTICSTASLHPADLFRAVRVLDSMMQKSGGFEEGPITWKIRAKAYAAVYASQKSLLSPKLTLKFLVKVLRFNTCDKSSMETPVPRLPGVEPCAVSDEVYGDPPNKDTVHRRAMHTLPMKGNDCLPADSDIAWHIQKEAVTAYDALMDTYRTPAQLEDVFKAFILDKGIEAKEAEGILYGGLRLFSQICLRSSTRPTQKITARSSRETLSATALLEECFCINLLIYCIASDDIIAIQNDLTKGIRPMDIETWERKLWQNMRSKHKDPFPDRLSIACGLLVNARLRCHEQKAIDGGPNFDLGWDADVFQYKLDIKWDKEKKLPFDFIYNDGLAEAMNPFK